MNKHTVGQSANPMFSLEEGIARRRLEQILNECSYEKILSAASKAPNPIQVIEEALKAALKLGRGERIVRLYRHLSKINSQTALLYSEYVAPYLLVANKNITSSQGQFAPGRELWNIPARLRKPIHKKIIY